MCKVKQNVEYQIQNAGVYFQDPKQYIASLSIQYLKSELIKPNQQEVSNYHKTSII